MTSIGAGSNRGAKRCERCTRWYKGLGTSCPSCRKALRIGSSYGPCARCGEFFTGYSTVCSPCKMSNPQGCIGCGTDIRFGFNSIQVKHGMRYHSECFKCQVCSVLLKPMPNGYFFNDNDCCVYCDKDYRLMLRNPPPPQTDRPAVPPTPQPELVPDAGQLAKMLDSSWEVRAVPSDESGGPVKYEVVRRDEETYNLFPNGASSAPVRRRRSRADSSRRRGSTRSSASSKPIYYADQSNFFDPKATMNTLKEDIVAKMREPWQPSPDPNLESSSKLNRKKSRKSKRLNGGNWAAEGVIDEDDLTDISEESEFKLDPENEVDMGIPLSAHSKTMSELAEQRRLVTELHLVDDLLAEMQGDTSRSKGGSSPRGPGSPLAKFLDDLATPTTLPSTGALDLSLGSPLQPLHAGPDQAAGPPATSSGPARRKSKKHKTDLDARSGAVSSSTPAAAAAPPQSGERKQGLEGKHTGTKVGKKSKQPKSEHGAAVSKTPSMAAKTAASTKSPAHRSKEDPSQQQQARHGQGHKGARPASPAAGAPPASSPLPTTSPHPTAASQPTTVTLPAAPAAPSPVPSSASHPPAISTRAAAMPAPATPGTPISTVTTTTVTAVSPRGPSTPRGQVEFGVEPAHSSARQGNNSSNNNNTSSTDGGIASKPVTTNGRSQGNLGDGGLVGKRVSTKVAGGTSSQRPASPSSARQAGPGPTNSAPVRSDSPPPAKISPPPSDKKTTKEIVEGARARAAKRMNERKTMAANKLLLSAGKSGTDLGQTKVPTIPTDNSSPTSTIATGLPPTPSSPTSPATPPAGTAGTAATAMPPTTPPTATTAATTTVAAATTTPQDAASPAVAQAEAASTPRSTPSVRIVTLPEPDAQEDKDGTGSVESDELFELDSDKDAKEKVEEPSEDEEAILRPKVHRTVTMQQAQAEIKFGVQASQNGCSYMEDANSARIIEYGCKPSKRSSRVSIASSSRKSVKAKGCYHYFAVFDGHGGSRAAAYAIENVPELLAENFDNLATDMEGSLKSAFETTESDWLKQADKRGWEDGSTAAVALVDPQHKVFWIANVGDSEILMITKKSGAPQPQSNFVTQVHTPRRSRDERIRVEVAGGRVLRNGYVGNPDRRTDGRNGAVAVSRSIGDAHLKLPRWTKGVPTGLIAEPYIACVPYGEEDVQHQSLVLASDGLWDVVRFEEVAEIVLNETKKGSKLDLIAQRLLVLARRKGSLDNITVMVVVLK